MGDIGTFSETISVTSNSTKIIIDIINMVLVGVIANTVSALGIFGNIINIVVFFTQGLRTTVNISFFSLAISDLCNLITIAWFSICVNPYLNADPDLIIFPPEFQHLTAGFPHACFARITAWITVFMTVERCLCITFPFKIKEMITPKRTVITIICIYLFVIAAMIPEYLACSERSSPISLVDQWGKGLRTTVNISFFSLAISDLCNLITIAWFSICVNPYLNADPDLIIFPPEFQHLTAGFPHACFARITAWITVFMTVERSVIIFTTVLVVKLNQKSQWRQKSTFDSAQSETISRRDRSTMKTVILIASVLIINFSPTVAFFTGVFIVPEFSITGRQRNLFLVSAAFCFIFDTLNSSVTIISYYTMSSKYRQTFHELLSCCLRKKVDALSKVES
uniref:G-protein coupled receptors family 1 profile domain-containing protein n=1 Tax=Biomphalaria glabrata TaxID=6526 RepID=A0A2C9KBT4_BIOGL